MFIKLNQFASLILTILIFFSVQYSAFALTIVQTENVNISAVVGNLPTIDPGGSGGGVYQSGVRFSGSAYPGATITVLKRDGTNKTTIADNKGLFSIFIPENNWQLFTLFATDTLGRKSTLLNFPTILYSGVITDISGIRFPPTINTDKLSVKQGDYLTIEGSSLPNTNLEVVFDGEGGRVFSLVSDASGIYNITIPINLSKGDYVLRTRYINDTRTSKAISITVGDASILRIESDKNIPGDCNFDQRVTLVDFSVLAYWYGKPKPPKCVDTNGDGTINLIDFSILAFYWNG
jgi:hypothetical protein